MMLSLNTYAQKIVGDMNGDGTLNISDVTLLVDKIMKGESQIEQEYVDLGLSVKWATANIGAAKPEDPGFRFAWGETEPKESFTWSNYFDTKDGGKTFNIYTGGITNLDDKHDAASIASNGDGRMPTKEEWKELYDKCSISIKYVSGVRCSKFTGPNGNYITIPNSSNLDGTSAGTIPFAYWSSSIDTSNPANAMLFNGDFCSSKPRYYGASVRSVKDINDKVLISSITFVDEVIKAQPGESVTIKGYYMPWSANRTAIKWESSDPSIAKVSNGVITAVSDGKCTITATAVDGEAKATCMVTVSSITEYVDLELPSGTLWATMNVGAESPEDYGNYYAWGETKAYGEDDTSNSYNYIYNGSNSFKKTVYNWKTYKWGTLTTLTKYNTFKEFGLVDGRTVLELVDDAGYMNWGANWRMPTLSQMQELYENCTFKLDEINDKTVVKFTSKKNSSRYIIFPYAGYRSDDSNGSDGFEAHYWTCSLGGGVYPEEAYCLSIDLTSGIDPSHTFYRCNGCSVRLVRRK